MRQTFQFVFAFLNVPQAVLALRGSNGVGFREWLLIVRQRVDGTPPSPNNVNYNTKPMPRSSRAGETVVFSNMLIFTLMACY